MTNEDLYWWRVQRLWTMYSNITDDLVYKAMWERKLKESVLLVVSKKKWASLRDIAVIVVDQELQDIIKRQTV